MFARQVTGPTAPVPPTVKVSAIVSACNASGPVLVTPNVYVTVWPELVIVVGLANFVSVNDATPLLVNVQLMLCRNPLLWPGVLFD